MAKTQEEVMIARIRKGDRQAFDRFVIQYQGRVYYTALRMLHSHEDALDVSQDVFIKVWRNANTLKKGVKVYSWLYRITVNTCLDRIRWRKRHQTQPLSDQAVITIPEWRYETSPREKLREVMWEQRVRQALEQLPPRQKTVFVLRHYQNLKLREIAEILDKPLGTVKATLHHALLRLRDLLPKDDLLPLSDSCTGRARIAKEPQ